MSVWAGSGGVNVDHTARRHQLPTARANDVSVDTLSMQTARRPRYWVLRELRCQHTSSGRGRPFVHSLSHRWLHQHTTLEIDEYP